jgi:hypothetical protein
MVVEHSWPVADPDRLEQILRSTPWFWELLEAARDVDAPDWLLGAGALRTAVWDRLHGYAEPSGVRDVDLAFFDPVDLTPARDEEVENELRARLPHAPWEARNQAAVHLWYPAKFGTTVEPLTSSADAVGTWPETATSIAVRLHPDDRLEVVAPLGVDDLYALILRRNPRRVTEEQFEKRLQEKRITERWPQVTVQRPEERPVAPRA